MHIDPKDLEFCNVVIFAQVKKLRLSGRVRPDDVESFASEVQVRLLRVWDSFDPMRGPREAFINAVVNSAIASILREKNAQKRCGTAVPIESVANSLTDPSSTNGRQEHIINLRIDIAAVLPLLTPLQRQIAELLKHDPVTVVAEQMSMPRRTVRDHCARIRKAFRVHGIQEYT